MKRVVIVLLLFFAGFASAASDPLRSIAIMENERLLRMDPDITLASFFHSSDAKIRARAVLAAGRIGNKRVLPQLQSLVSDGDPEVRKNLAFALGQIKSKEGLPTAVSLLKDSNQQVRLYAIEAVGRIGGLENASLVLPFLDDADASLREQAALALALIKDKAAVPVLISKTETNDPAQWSYVYVLYRLADERAVPVLHQVLKNPAPSPSTGEPSSLLFALKALWSMKKPLTIEEADFLLRHKDARVQQNALDAMAASPQKDQCSVLTSHFASLSVHSRWKAIDTAGFLGCTEIIRESLNSGNPTFRGAAVAAIARSEKDIETLRKASADSSWIVRWRAAQALADIDEKDAVPQLKTLATDSDSAVKLAALDSLTKFLPGTVDVFLPLLKEKDTVLRAVAADAVGSTKDPQHLDLLMKSFRTAQTQGEIEGRISILDVFGDYPSSDVLPIYIESLEDPEFAVRRHAIDGIKKLTRTPVYLNGNIVDPEEFAYRDVAVSEKTAEQYPADFGLPMISSFAVMKLEKGEVVFRLLPEIAPLHVNNFRKLVAKKFYDGLRIHRVVPNFVIQGGDPRGDGWGDAGEVIHDQFHLTRFNRAMVGMPTAGKDTGGCQFFITHSRQPHLDGNYTIFGEIVSGMDVVDKTEIGDKILSVHIEYE